MPPHNRTLWQRSRPRHQVSPVRQNCAQLIVQDDGNHAPPGRTVAHLVQRRWR
jgi:hypothetical protein